MIEKITGQFLMFLHLNPGLGMFVLACLLTTGRKVARHFWKGGKNYTLADLWKYPSEALEILLIVSAFLISILYMIKEN